MAPTTETTKAKTLIAMAIHDRIVGPLLRRLSISNRHSQWSRVPTAQPDVACAICSMDIRFKSSEYAIEVTPHYLARCEAMSKSYRDQMSRGGVVPEHVMRTDLTDAAYLACFVVPELVAAIRHARGQGIEE
ncbi:hypothetical protein [Pseudoxanthomonas sp. Root630]|uniref:hypothetical protein n=1 Tax=Pseudoxanthomonas sp. Root630 TaxID=1736574 RepID=UPI000A655424|nr:hypothetical protein [Pseudoxanthomonas sp. Root630]